MITGRAASLMLDLTVWDRGLRQPGSIEGNGRLSGGHYLYASTCLAMTGFIANRRDLLWRTSSSPSLSDAELLEKIFDERGPGMASEVLGPVAWIVWDRRAQRLVAARDRAGTYGLFYLVDGEQIFLGGDIDRLIERARRTVRWNPRAAISHLHGGVPDRGETFYDQIASVEPGEILEIDREAVRRSAYWRISAQPKLRLASDEAYAESFRQRFFEVAADYSPPGLVALTLSGGLDSTAIAAAIRATSPASELKALRWTSPEVPEADEDRLSAAVCRRLTLDGLTLRADHWAPLSFASGLTTLRTAPQLMYFFEMWEETFRLAAEQGISCMLTGSSGDNLFGGHLPIYADLLLTGRWPSLVRQLSSHARGGGAVFGALNTILRRLLIAPLARAVFPASARFRPRPVPWLGSRYRDVWEPPPAESFGRLLPGRQARLEMLSERQLPWTTLLQGEHAARHGIELRHPFLDHRMFELAASLPSDQTYRAGWTKHVQRLAMRGRLPREVLTLPAKIHPAAICYRSLREQYSAKVWELLRNMRAADLGFVDERKLRAAYGDFLAGRTDSTDFWPALTLEAWLRQHFD